MQSKATTVDEYMKEVPAERLEALTRLRDMCREILTGYEEVMDYGMPGYTKDGIGEVGFNSQKQYISLYILKLAVVDKYRDRLPNAGKCCIRFTRPEKMNFDLIRLLLEETVASTDAPC